MSDTDGNLSGGGILSANAAFAAICVASRPIVRGFDDQ